MNKTITYSSQNNHQEQLLSKILNILVIGVIVLAALIASSGTLPFGWDFAKNFFSANSVAHFIFGVLFAATAALANTALGTYSLLAIKRATKKFEQRLLAAFISAVGAIPSGFICYEGYKNMIPAFFAAILSLIVSLVNGAIGYTAMKNAIKNIYSYLATDKTTRAANKKSTQPISIGEKIAKICGLIIGISVTVTFYLASAQGLIDIFMNLLELPLAMAKSVSYPLAVILWLPGAALFGNSTQIVAGTIYRFIVEIRQNIQAATYKDLSITIFSLFSGGAFAQMTAEFFNPAINIPDIFKSPFIQLLAVKLLVPFAFIASASVNMVALKSATHTINKEIEEI